MPLDPKIAAPFDTPWFNKQDKTWFNSLNKSVNYPLVLTGDSDEFAQEVAVKWRDEGFSVTYIPLGIGGQDWVRRVHAAGEAGGVGEYYAIVAFEEAATLALEAHLKPNNPRLCAVVAYYPISIPQVTTKYPPGVKVLVHLVGDDIGVIRNPEVLGIQGKRKTVKKRLDPGAGYGGSLDLAYPAYTYDGVEPGFAEHDLEEYNAVAEGLAFSRSLGLLRKAFRKESDIELVRDRLLDSTASAQEQKFAKSIRADAHVLYGPTLTGGVGEQNIAKFYTNFFQPMPPSLRAKLLSRTVGTDRVVDELLFTFQHSHVIPWMLPDIPPTFKKVEIVVVSIVCIRGDKLESEHVYWDQASVLVQVGLLDSRMVPKAMKSKVPELPVWGAEEARTMKRGGGGQVNALIEAWESKKK